MNYQEFLQRNRYQDSPYAKQAFQEQFGGSPEFNYASGSRIGGRSSPGKVWGVPSGHASAAGRGGMTADYAQELERRNFPLPEDYEASNLGLSSPNEAPLTDIWGTGVDRGMSGLDAYQGPADYDAYKQYLNGELTHDLAGNRISGFDRFAPDTGSYTYQNEEILLDPESPYLSPSDSLAVAPNLPSAAPTSLLSAGPSGYASIDAAAETTLPYAGQGISEELAQTATEAGADSAWGGPATFAANQALNLIPTRDREKKVTPFGDEGSVSGILKGTGKGALTGATIGSHFGPKGALVGGLIGGSAGLIGGAQGYFDSTSAPMISMSRIKRRGGGMQGGLLGGGSMYG